jgi:hypothetical protein
MFSQEQQVPRFLQNEELVSNCFCPITAELIIHDAPSANQVQEAFQLSLREEDIPLTVQNIDEVDVVE